MNEYLYLLSNPSIPNLIKIGMTKNTPDERMEQLFSTGVPEKFILEYSVIVPDSAVAERLAHTALNSYRHRSNREFFSVSVIEAVAIINSNIGTYIPHTDRLDTARKVTLKKAREEEEAALAKEMQIAKAKAENIVRLESQKSKLKKHMVSIQSGLAVQREQLASANKQLTNLHNQYKKLGVRPAPEKQSIWSFSSKQSKYNDMFKEFVKPWNELEVAIKNSQEKIHFLEMKLTQAEQDADKEISKIMLILNGP